ncbi:MAG: hypothetical protein DHS20C02_18950 [Micavibrio sp.]|nr:MAG: hypothetical protein DHS20C02_18950 [Micavibrio sp.]
MVNLMMRFIFVALFLAGLLPFSSPAQSADAAEIQTVLVANQEATLASPMKGQIVKLDFFNGDQFSKDDVLVAFDCRIIEAQYAGAAARLEGANATLGTKKKLKELKSASKLEYALAVAEAKQANAEAREYKVQKELCVIKAPYDGRVTGKDANLHETVESGQPLLKIASMDKLQAQLLVPSVWLSWLKTGSALRLKIDENGKSYAAHIIRIGGEVDAVSQSIMVVAELDEREDDLLPGMSGTAYFNTPTPRKEAQKTKLQPASQAGLLQPKQDHE